jgi:error-prone DNA polymerase
MRGRRLVFYRGLVFRRSTPLICAQLNLPGMALLDRDGFYGSPRFYMAMKKAGLKGMNRSGGDLYGWGKIPSAGADAEGISKPMPFDYADEDARTGKHPKPGQEAAARPEELEEFAEGLLCLTGDENGPLARAMARDEHVSTNW